MRSLSDEAAPLTLAGPPAGAARQHFEAVTIRVGDEH